MYITQIKSVSALIDAAQNFYTIASTNAATLGLTAANLTEINNAVNALNNGQDAVVAAKAAYKGSVSTRKGHQDALATVIGRWAKVFDSNAAIPNGLLETLGLPPHETPGSVSPPAQPFGLQAVADGQGIVRLSWKRNGNASSTVFLVEALIGATGNWVQIGGVTVTKFKYTATMGVPIAFRVFATRKGQKSDPSPETYLWGTPASAGVELKVA